MCVLFNGNLVICGEKWFMLNIGEEFICLEGLVCLEDVLVSNIVMLNCIVNVCI